MAEVKKEILFSLTGFLVRAESIEWIIASSLSDIIDRQKNGEEVFSDEVLYSLRNMWTGVFDDIESYFLKKIQEISNANVPKTNDRVTSIQSDAQIKIIEPRAITR